MQKRVGIFAIILAIVILAISCLYSYNDTEYVLTVTDKERIVSTSSGEVSSKYLVFAEDDNGQSYVFENSDNFLRLKFNSSDIQGVLKQNNKYRFTVVGFRMPLFSAYQNIIKVEEVTDET